MRLMLTAALALSVRTFGGRNAQCKSRYMSRTKNRSIARLLEDLSTTVTRWTGESSAFALACTVILVWGVSGPLFHYSGTWQLVINTATTIVTFLMVFLIQRSQNKESMAVQLKLNELVAAINGASNRLIDIEDLAEDELQALHRYYARLASMAKRDDSLTRSHSIDEAQEQHVRKSRRRTDQKD